MHMEFLNQLKIENINLGSSTGQQWISSSGPIIESISPVDGKKIASVETTDKTTYDKVISSAMEAFLLWRDWPAPKRGDIVRQIGDTLRTQKESLGKLVS